MSLKCILQGQNLAKDELDTHISDTNNPHNVTITQIGAAASIHTHTADQISGLPTSLPASDVYPWAKQPNKPSYNYSEVGAAAASHNHDSRYYTETEVNNLLSGKSATGHKHAASDITSGLLDIARGGTGVGSIDELKTALGIVSGGAKIYQASYNFHGDATITVDFTPYAFILVIEGDSSTKGGWCIGVRPITKAWFVPSPSSSTGKEQVSVSWFSNSVYINLPKYYETGLVIFGA